ncbi:hypothetical protein VTN49DRAFT_6436 [Thermomyces lanuginosus]|uniref:uncharacterized protein n=1 Tax=Thermomyces lanuginosus TaxID=5541 RepID=UPI00374426CB
MPLEVLIIIPVNAKPHIPTLTSLSTSTSGIFCTCTMEEAVRPGPNGRKVSRETKDRRIPVVNGNRSYLEIATQNSVPDAS